MKDQHKQIKGYRDLSQSEIDLMNRAKDLAQEVGNLIQDVLDDPLTDKRWVSIGKTDIQKGFMSLIRGIAQPTTF